MPPNCSLCNDTGVIVTGNNDLPCTCKAGDTARFNSNGKNVSGAEVKKELGYNSETYVGKTQA